MQTYELQITIGDITFNDLSNRTKFYKVDNTPELLTTLSAERSETSKQGGHGSIDTPSRYGSRTIPFSGEILAPTIDERVAMERELQKTLALAAIQDATTSDGSFLVQFRLEDGTLVQCYAKILQPPSFYFRDDPIRRHQIRRFSFALVAADPNLYSQTLQSESGEETYAGSTFSVVQGVSPTVPFSLSQNTVISATCTNNGTADAPPAITIYGPTTGPKITNVTTDKFIYLEGLTLGDSEYVTIDVSKGTIKKNDDTNLTAYWGDGSEWWVLVAGDNDITLLDDTESLIEATCAIHWRDTFI